MPKVPEQNINGNAIKNIVRKLLWLEKEVESLKIKVLEHKQVHELTHPVSEIERLYKNAGVELVADVKFPTKDVNYNVSYPPFTAEKQLKLIEFFISSIWWENLKILYKTLDCSLNFKDKLAKIVNYLWLSLSEEEKQQVKGILE